jgi:hypothetical protein
MQGEVKWLHAKWMLTKIILTINHTAIQSFKRSGVGILESRVLPQDSRMPTLGFLND